MKETIEKIKSRGHWKVIIRPSDFEQNRISDLNRLKEIIPQVSVTLRGWSLPHIDRHNPIQVGLDWIQQEVEWSDHVEAWRLYQSGQFIFWGSIRDDWLDQSFWGPPPQGWEVGASISVIDVVFRFTEIFEFAARLSMTEAGGELMNIDVTLFGLKNRRLRIDSPSRAGFDYPRICHVESFPQQFSVSRQELVAEPKVLALKASKELFERFDWSPSIELLRGIQDELGR
jgi:hypothetical protein